MPRGTHEERGRTEVRVVCDTRRRARRRGVVRTRAAVRVVDGVAEPGFAGTLAANGRAGGVDGPLELSGTYVVSCIVHEHRDRR